MLRFSNGPKPNINPGTWIVTLPGCGRVVKKTARPPGCDCKCAIYEIEFPLGIVATRYLPEHTLTVLPEEIYRQVEEEFGPDIISFSAGSYARKLLAG